VDCALYVDGIRQTQRGSYREMLQQAKETGGFVWMGLYEPTASDLADVAAAFGLHELAVEDAVQAHQRPKVEDYGDSLFAVFKTVRYVPHEKLTATSQIVATGEVMLFVGPDFLVTVRHGEHGELASTRKSLEADAELLRMGPMAILHRVADTVVDGYVAAADCLQDDIDELETSVFSPARTRDVERIYQLKREVLEFKHAVVPLEQPLRHLAGTGMDVGGKRLRNYFRDVADHLTRVGDQISSYDELLTSMIHASLAQVQAAQNEDMRRISAWVAIFAVPTAIAGIYGMNFEYMPELKWKLGYPFALGLIAVLCWALYRGFKRNGWL
jgi:magnesium transporter